MKNTEKFTDSYFRLLGYYNKIKYRKAYKNYEKWLKTFELNSKDIYLQSEISKSLVFQPSFSFITPVFNPPLDIFIEMINSVFSQTYPNWELCLANGSTDLEIEKTIEKYTSIDDRIKTIKILNNGISANSNQALNMSSGEYIVLLDHDDTIFSDLLFKVAYRLNSCKDVDVIYYDEDKIDIDGRHIDPFFKPETFRYSLFLYRNYLTHCVLRKDLIKKIGYFNPDMDGAQDWDLFYRCIEITDKIIHIPRILYSWRKIEGSAALNIDQKPYAIEKQKEAREAHLKRISLSNR